MREIKFRAWYEQRKQMYNDVGLLWNVTVLPTAPENENAIGLPIMQFTGLRDKNGKEIYEGDIIELPNKEITRCHIEWNDCKFIRIFTSKKRKIDMIKNYMPNNIRFWEVIGNIYGNPELMELEK